MNNKGFTMVELVATIALLSVIMIISFVSINAVIDSSEINECNALVSNIKSATKEYFSDNRYNLDNISGYKVDNNDKKYEVNVSVLTSNNYLTDDIVNPFDDEKLSNDDIKISVELNDNYTIKKIVVKNSSNNEVVCDNEEW